MFPYSYKVKKEKEGTMEKQGLPAYREYVQIVAQHRAHRVSPAHQVYQPLADHHHITWRMMMTFTRLPLSFINQLQRLLRLFFICTWKNISIIIYKILAILTIYKILFTKYIIINNIILISYDMHKGYKINNQMQKEILCHYTGHIDFMFYNQLTMKDR